MNTDQLKITTDQNYNFHNNLCHAAVTAAVYFMINDFERDMLQGRMRTMMEDQMKGKYSTAKFLADERVKDHQAKAKDQRLSMGNGKKQGKNHSVEDSWAKSKQQMAGITSHLVYSLRWVGGARPAT